MPRAPKMKPVVVARVGAKGVVEPAHDDGAVDAALSAVNGSASAHTITSRREVLEVCEEVERMLARRRLPVGRRGPCRVEYRPAGPEAASYRYRVVTTSIALDRTKSGVWKLVDAARDRASPRSSRRLSIEITAEMCCEMAERAIEPFAVGGASLGSMLVAEPGRAARAKPWFRVAVLKGEDSREDMYRWCHDNLAEGFWIAWDRQRAHGWFEDQTDAGLFRLKYHMDG